jgi:hypothetical protein
MSFDPVAQVKRYHAALNGYREEAVRPMFAARAVYASPGVGGRIEGREAILSAFRDYFAAHPDQVAEDESVTALSPLSARAVWRLRATAEPAGRIVERRGVETVRFDSDGLIIAVEVEDR